MILSAYDDYIPINNSMAIQHFLMVITLRMTHGLYRIHTSNWTRKRQNNGVGIYEYMLTCVAFGVNHTVDLHVFFSQCDVLDDVEMTVFVSNFMESNAKIEGFASIERIVKIAVY